MARDLLFFLTRVSYQCQYLLNDVECMAPLCLNNAIYMKFYARKNKNLAVNCYNES